MMRGGAYGADGAPRMLPDDEAILAGDLAACLGFSCAAARLLVALARDGALPSTCVPAPVREEVVAAGAATIAGNLLVPRPRDWMLRRVAVAGVRLCVETCGRGSAVVLVPPFGTYRRHWGTAWGTGAFASIGRHHRAIAIDYRGTGCSDVDDAPYTLEGCADDLLAVLDALGVVHAHLVGLSLGGAVALRAALAAPSRVTSLVLCAAAAGALDTPTRDAADALLSLLPSRRLEWAIRVYLRSPVARVPGASVAELLAIGRRSIRTRENFANLYRANVFRSDVTPRLRAIDAPTLVLVGEHDAPFFQAEARTLAAGIRGAELGVVVGAGHVLSEHDPETFHARVLAFLARHDGVRR